MEERVLGRSGDSVAVLAYRAEARRAEDGPYRAYCTSTYVRSGDGWKLVQHQQTPIA